MWLLRRGLLAELPGVRPLMHGPAPANRPATPPTHHPRSIVRAAGGLEWRPLVERAAAKFREAGASGGLGGGCRSHKLLGCAISH